jgi:sugar lactone lactonase YvrE
MLWVWLALVGCGPDCDESGVACVVVGDGGHGFAGEGVPAREARLYFPTDVTWRPGFDQFVITDWNNERLRGVDEHRDIFTVVGADFPGDGNPAGGDRADPGAPGFTIGLNHPVQAEFAPNGLMYIAAWHNHKVRRWDPDTGLVRVVVANHDQTTGNNGGFTGDGGPAELAHIWFPSSVAFDAEGAGYLVDQKNLRVRRFEDGGNIDTVAGCGEPGLTDGPALEATFRFPDNPASAQPLPSGDIDIDRERGVAWIADTWNHAIRRMVLGSGEITTLEVDTPLTPFDLELGPDGRLYVADATRHRLLAVDPETGATEHIAGTGEAGRGVDGQLATELPLNNPGGLDVDEAGRLLIVDSMNSLVWLVNP